MEFFDVTGQTIDNCIEKNEREPGKNGYEVLVGNQLIDFKLVISRDSDSETDFVIKPYGLVFLISGNSLNIPAIHYY